MCSSGGTADVALVALITSDLVNYVSGEAEVISRGWLQLDADYCSYVLVSAVVDLCAIRTVSPSFLKIVLIL